MHNALGNDKLLLRTQVHRAIFEVDDKVPVQDKEKLIIVIVFVPVYSPCTTPKRTTESLTWQSVWLYHFSVQAFTKDATSTKSRAGI
jgi:hypothetical protein